MEQIGNSTEISLKQREDFKKEVELLESVLEQSPDVIHGDSDKLPLKHYFPQGMYAREMAIPKGTRVTGKIHKHQSVVFLMKGKIFCVTQYGEEILEAPRFIISSAGTKRAALAIEDCVWIDVHANPENKTDLIELENDLIAPTYEDYDKYISTKITNQLTEIQ